MPAAAGKKKAVALAVWVVEWAAVRKAAAPRDVVVAAPHANAAEPSAAAPRNAARKRAVPGKAAPRRVAASVVALSVAAPREAAERAAPRRAARANAAEPSEAEQERADASATDSNSHRCIIFIMRKAAGDSAAFVTPDRAYRSAPSVCFNSLFTTDCTQASAI